MASIIGVETLQHTNGTTAATIDSSGNVVISNATSEQFYEEGTHTPTDESGAGLTFTGTITGAYVRIGRIVYYNFQVQYPSTSDTSLATISLPFNSANSSDSNTPINDWSLGGFVTYSNQTVANSMTLLVAQGEDYIRIYNDDGGNITNANLSGKHLRGTVIYIKRA